MKDMLENGRELCIGGKLLLHTIGGTAGHISGLLLLLGGDYLGSPFGEDFAG